MSALLRYYRNSDLVQEQSESVEEALKTAYWGEEGGCISTESVVGDGGRVVFSRSSDENIFDFCEYREYGWVVNDD